MQSDLQAGPLHLGARSLSIGGPNNLLPDLPEKIVTAPEYNKNYPMIIGTTKDDGSYVATGSIKLTLPITMTIFSQFSYLQKFSTIS